MKILGFEFLFLTKDEGDIFSECEGGIDIFFMPLVNIFNKFYQKDVFMKNNWTRVYIKYELQWGVEYFFMCLREVGFFHALKGGLYFFWVTDQIIMTPPMPVLNGDSLSGLDCHGSLSINHGEELQKHKTQVLVSCHITQEGNPTLQFNSLDSFNYMPHTGSWIWRVDVSGHHGQELIYVIPGCWELAD